MTEEEKDLLLQEMQRQHILHGGGLGRPIVDGTMRLEMSPPFDTGTVSGVSGGRLLNNPYTQPMNLGQGVGNRGTMADMFGVPMPPQMPPQMPQQVPTGLPNMNRRNDPLTNALTQTVMPTARQQQRPVPQVQPQARPDDSRLGTPTQGRAFPAFNRTPLPTQNNPPVVPKPPDIPLRRTPSKWDLMKESMFAGEDQQGLFGKAGIDPNDPKKRDRGSMGLSGFFGDLFNDPARMAMLSGGLTALDPNSYYDKEGFGSPWTGLRSGLGGAQAGYKSVIDRRKAEADTALAKAKTKNEISTAYEDKLSVTSTNTEVLALNKSLVSRLTKKYMQEEGLNQTQAYRKAVSEASAIVQSKGMREKDSRDLFEQWNTGEVTLKKIRDAKKLVRPDTMSLLAKAKRGFDIGLTIAQITHSPSDATKLKQVMDELAYPMMQSIMGIPLTSKLIDSEAERDLIKDLSQNPAKYGNPMMLLQKLNTIEGLYEKLQKDRKQKLGGRAYDSPSGGTRKPLAGGDDPEDFINALTPPQ